MNKLKFFFSENIWFSPFILLYMGFVLFLFCLLSHLDFLPAFLIFIFPNRTLIYIQYKDMKNYGSAQCTGVKDQYYDQITKIREYSSGQLDRSVRNLFF